MRIHYYFELAKIVLISFPLPLSADNIRYKLLSLQQQSLFFVRRLKKKRRKFAVYEKVVTFAASNKRVGDEILFYGVMVAQQILVLFVQVRILVEQQKENKLIGLFSFFYLLPTLFLYYFA